MRFLLKATFAPATRLLILLLLCSLDVRPASAQPVQDDLEISVITVYPGDQVYTTFGHSAFRVQDRQTGEDLLYNYGTFEFDAAFVPRFLYGKLDYYLSVVSFPRAFRYYRSAENRAVVEQTLDLTLPQARALRRFLRHNALPENRYYRYDFLYDNCSTRIVDALKIALEDSLQFEATGLGGASFRELLAPYMQDTPLLKTGTDLGLGLPVDRLATDEQAAFLPIGLLRLMDATRLDGRPLVARTDTLYWYPGAGSEETAWPWPPAIAWLLLFAGAAWSLRTDASRRGRDWLDATLLFVVGIAGLILAFLWFVSLHYVTAPNLNLFWAWPTHLIAAYLIARGVPFARWRWYGYAVIAVTGVLLIGWAWWPQQLPPAAFPLALLVAVRLADRLRRG